MSKEKAIVKNVQLKKLSVKKDIFWGLYLIMVSVLWFWLSLYTTKHSSYHGSILFEHCS